MQHNIDKNVGIDKYNYLCWQKAELILDKSLKTKHVIIVKLSIVYK